MTLTKAVEILTDNAISLAMTGTVIYMLLHQIPVPDWFIGLYGSIIAFYFMPTSNVQGALK